MAQIEQGNDRKLPIIRDQIKQQAEYIQDDQTQQNGQKQIKIKSQRQLLKQKNKKQRQQRLKKSRMNNGKKIDGITIPKAIRPIDKKIQFIPPSPATYQPDKMFNNQSITIPKATYEQHQPIKQINIVGPGCYFNQQQKKNNNNQASQFTIGWKYDSIFDSKSKINPGPADYNVINQLIEYKSKNKSKSSALNTGFGTSNRFSMHTIIPGPADYENFKKPQQSINKKRTISNVGRQDVYKEQKNPGPGYYQKISQFEYALYKGKGMTIGLQKNKRLSLPNLTEQSYNKYIIARDFENVKGPSYSIGKQKRSSMDGNENPGPNQYLPVLPVSHSPSASINNAYTIQKKKEQPGPGTYQKVLIPNSLKYSMGKSKSISSLNTGNQSPGVGRYNIAHQFLKAKYKHNGAIFSKQKRMQDSLASSVGVGDYNIGNSMENSSNKGFTIPRASTNLNKN